ncbi:hypothetical protein KQ941_01925 [Paenibacillus xylanexedens]|uniref:hypothetical protein n=1 Tax=Paenibacillus xylanexedens TaxID=528191 RepID=UPI001F2901D4|nr:hypothetical protein [Paenibacillus xylanexedens]MCF7753184.1 hypothetical protein [Paenibacillus xylanexedens]
MILNKSDFSIRKDNTNKLKYFLLCKIDQLGEFKFEDDSWYYRKKHINSLPKGNFTITFYQIPVKYREWVKYYSLSCDSSPTTIHKKCLSIASFLKFIEEHPPPSELHQITRLQVNAFEFHLKQLDISESKKQHTYASVQDFFMRLTDFPDFSNVTPVKQLNPFKQSSIMKSDMLLPKRVITAWDKAFKNENLDIPLELRVVYWLIRSFPNRITEILSMKIDSLKSFYSQYVIQIPTYKQNGGHPEAVLKPIPVVYAGHGKYVIDLLKRLQIQTKQYLNSPFNSANNRQDLLFCVRYWNFNKRKKSPSICINPKRTDILQNWTGFKLMNCFHNWLLY